MGKNRWQTIPICIRNICQPVHPNSTRKSMVMAMSKAPGVMPALQNILANCDITKKWTAPIRNCALILNQLIVRFEQRLSF